MSKTFISATIRVRLKPWSAPNFAVRDAAAARGQPSGDGIPVAELDDATLEEMAAAWLTDLYRKAGRTYVPFTRHEMATGATS